MADVTTINQGIDITNRVLDTADYKKWLNLILTLVILLVFTLALIWLVKTVGGNLIGGLWDFVSTPIRRIINKADVSKETGMKPEITSSKAKDIADQIDNCFHWDGDDEEGLFNILRKKINNAADWYLVKEEFGTRVCSHWPSARHSGDIEHIISHSLGSKDRATVRSILQSKGITTTI